MEHLPEGTHARGFHEELIPLMKGSRGKRDPNWSCERYIQTFLSVGFSQVAVQEQQGEHDFLNHQESRVIEGEGPRF